MFLTVKQPAIGSWSNQYLQGYILVAMVTTFFFPLLSIRQLDDSHRVTVYCRDGDGRTGLHHAARMGGIRITVYYLGRVFKVVGLSWWACCVKYVNGKFLTQNSSKHSEIWSGGCIARTVEVAQFVTIVTSWVSQETINRKSLVQSTLVTWSLCCRWTLGWLKTFLPLW